MLSIAVVNYNSSIFLRRTLRSLFYLTRNPYEILVCDNGSEPADLARLKNLCALFPNVTLITRTQTASGSMGHGEALNLLVERMKHPYGVLLDADCIPLTLHWDQFLLEKLDARCKVAGTPVAVDSPGNLKPVDFPLIFLCMFEVAAIRALGVDFRPKDIKALQDTGWELRAKCLAAGYTGMNLLGRNTRTFKDGAFSGNICDEYYTDDSYARLFCSHLGRGSNPNSGKYSRNRRRAATRYRKDRDAWLARVDAILDSEVRAAGRLPDGPFETVACDQCGSEVARKVLTANDLHNRLPGFWDVVECAHCGLAYTNPRPRGEEILRYYPESYPCYQETTPGSPPSASAGAAGLRSRVRRQLLRQHFGAFPGDIPTSGFWKAATAPLAWKPAVQLYPRFPAGRPQPRLLEIGCGVGGYLRTMASLGWDVVGVEPSASAAERARAGGLDVRCADIAELDFPPGEFDAITLNMVLEHLPSPRRALERIRGWLRPGGELLLAVPDFGGFEARLFGPYHYGLQVPTHLYHFTPASLRRLLPGFRVEVRHQAFHRDLKAGLEYWMEDNPGSRWRLLLKLPRPAFTGAAYLLSFLGRTSRISVRATLLPGGDARPESAETHEAARHG